MSINKENLIAIMLGPVVYFVAIQSPRQTI